MHNTGDVIGDRYRIVRPLGEGSTGKVYLVQKSGNDNRLLALKEFDIRGMSDDEKTEYRELFYREAEILQSLDHPGLPRFIESFSTGDSHFLVMEYIEGKTLDERMEIENSPLTPDEVIRIAYELAIIIDNLHNQKPAPIIYRDLKPSNIMLTKGGSIKLIDFGIARHYKPRNIRDTHFMGTPGFSAPEQYGRGQSDVRTDIYSFGATIYHLLTRKDMTGFNFRFPPLRQYIPGVPSGLERIIMRCLSLNPGERYQSASVLAGDLRYLWLKVSPCYSLVRIPALWAQLNMRPGLRYALACIGALIFSVLTPSATGMPAPGHVLSLLYPVELCLFLLIIIYLITSVAHQPRTGEYGRAVYYAIVILCSLFIILFLSPYYWKSGASECTGVMKEGYNSGASGSSACDQDSHSLASTGFGHDAEPGIKNNMWNKDGMFVTSLHTSQDRAFSFATDDQDCYDGIAILYVDETPHGSILRIKKISTFDEKSWSNTEKDIYTSQNLISKPKILSDSRKGWFIFWCEKVMKGDHHRAGHRLMMQHLNAEGEPLLRKDGVEILESMTVEESSTEDELPIIERDTSGGVFLCWTGSPRESNECAESSVLKMQRIDSSGKKLWGSSGIDVANSLNNVLRLKNIRMISDGEEGAFVIWEEEGTFVIWAGLSQQPACAIGSCPPGSGILFAQKISKEGKSLWREGGVPLGTTSQSATPVRDGRGGLYLAWVEAEDSDASRVRIQALSSTGLSRWQAGGLAVGKADKSQTEVCAASDGECGIVVAWVETGMDLRICMQQLDNSGAEHWGSEGLEIISERSESALHLKEVKKMSEKFFFVWSADRGKGASVYLQQVLDESKCWAEDGESLTVRDSHPVEIQVDSSFMKWYFVWAELSNNCLKIYAGASSYFVPGEGIF